MILLIETATQIRQKIPERRARRRVPIERRRQRIVDQGETGNLMLADTGERLYGSRNSVEDSWARTMLRGGLRSRDDSRVTVARSRSDARRRTILCRSRKTLRRSLQHVYISVLLSSSFSLALPFFLSVLAEILRLFARYFALDVTAA